MPETPLERAKRLFNIQDVYICDVNAFADRAFDPTLPIENVNIQLRATPSGGAEQFWIEIANKKRNCLRYYIDTGLRILKPGVDPNVETIEREQLLAEITATFVVKYFVSDDNDVLEHELVDAFSDHAVHHMWPYWREFIQTSTARLRLPAVVLPMRRVKIQSAELGAVK